MNGPHDVGGMMGFGPVVPEAGEPVFHAAWERRAFAINLAASMTGSWNIDQARHERELLPPDVYWRSSYYEMRHYALENQLEKLGLVARGGMQQTPRPVKQVPGAERAAEILAGRGSYEREALTPAGFAVGDKVRVRNIQPHGHTRLPGYARGKTGEIAAVHGAHVFPDSSAMGTSEDPRWLYTVKFSSRELWGREDGASICADLWEPYLEAA